MVFRMLLILQLLLRPLVCLVEVVLSWLLTLLKVLMLLWVWVVQSLWVQVLMRLRLQLLHLGHEQRLWLQLTLIDLMFWLQLRLLRFQEADEVCQTLGELAHRMVKAVFCKS